MQSIYSPLFSPSARFWIGSNSWLSQDLSFLLTLIFKASLHQGEIPEQWKKACVTPLFKKGDREKAANYRPVMLMSGTAE
jgi:hypothetical protein